MIGGLVQNIERWSNFCQTCLEIQIYIHIYIRATFTGVSSTQQYLTAIVLCNSSALQGVDAPSFLIRPLVIILLLGIPFGPFQEEPNQIFWQPFFCYTVNVSIPDYDDHDVEYIIFYSHGMIRHTLSLQTSSLPEVPIDLLQISIHISTV